MQNVLDTRRKLEVIWMTLINLVHYHTMACLSLRKGGALRMKQSICEILEGSKSSTQYMRSC